LGSISVSIHIALIGISGCVCLQIKTTFKLCYPYSRSKGSAQDSYGEGTDGEEVETDQEATDMEDSGEETAPRGSKKQAVGADRPAAVAVADDLDDSQRLFPDDI
jgi:hypothetical protein